MTIYHLNYLFQTFFSIFKRSRESFKEGFCKTILLILWSANPINLTLCCVLIQCHMEWFAIHIISLTVQSSLFRNILRIHFVGGRWEWALNVVRASRWFSHYHFSWFPSVPLLKYWFVGNGLCIVHMGARTGVWVTRWHRTPYTALCPYSRRPHSRGQDLQVRTRSSLYSLV